MVAERSRGSRMPTRGYRVPAPRRIAFINEKGGSAKTTLVANIASHLVLRRGRRVLAIDMDPQGQLGKVLGVDVRQTRRTAIDLVLDTLLGDPGLDRRAESSGDPTSSLPIVRTHLPSLDVIVANKSLALFPHWEGADAEDPTGRLQGALDPGPASRAGQSLPEPEPTDRAPPPPWPNGTGPRHPLRRQCSGRAPSSTCHRPP